MSETTSGRPVGGMSAIAARGSAFNSAQWFANKLATAAAMFLVARVVSPEQYGLASQSLAIYQFVVFLAPLTLGDVLIARPRHFARLEPSARRLAWRIGVSMSLAVVVVIPIAVTAYSQYPQAWLAGLLATLALRPLFEASIVAPLAKLRTALQFRQIAFVEGIVQFGATCLMLVSASLGAGAAALVAPQIAAVAVRSRVYSASSLVSVTGRVSAMRERLLFMAFMPAALAQYAHNILVMLDIMILGYVTSSGETGLFGLAFTLAAQANTIISYQLGQVLQPIFGHMQDEPRRQVTGFIRVQRVLAAVCVPIAVAQAVVAEPLFRLVFPADWQGAVVPFQILSLAQAAYFATGPTMSCLRAQHRFRFLFWWQATQLMLSVPLYAAGAHAFGSAGVAVASGVAWLVRMSVGIRTVIRGVEPQPLLTAVGVLARPWIVCLPGLLVGGLVIRTLAQFGNVGDVISVLFAAPLILVSMLVSMRYFNKDVDQLFGVMTQSVRRRVGI